MTLTHVSGSGPVECSEISQPGPVCVRLIPFYFTLSNAGVSDPKRAHVHTNRPRFARKCQITHLRSAAGVLRKAGSEPVHVYGDIW